ncbi:ATP-dependent nuclease [Sphingobium sp. TCM1]|uniref:ATP-dependent nuclease n=1 Tax=Sphingobium sp. TCM1 TaxID=453246 RepID=UPI0007F52204|nr:ATP-binding protein [Sphingobium sp. TCM1]OAN53514.1 ATP-dependent endonuclease [Sphingobium sp. TCM1]
MARIRKVEIRNFRSIATLDWFPLAGINCLIGPGDSGKSTILDAIDFCLGARRNLTFCDDDFHRLQLEQPIRIGVTLGELDSHLRSMEAYGLYLRGFNFQTGAIEPEPGSGLDTVLTVELSVGDDLEPQWQLVSERAAALGQSRGLSWADRVRLAPTRLGQSGEHNLSWKRGSILNKVSEERASAASAIAQAARDARITFGDKAKDQLGEALAAVQATAGRLGVPIAGQVQALLDAHGVNVTGGTISLHGGDGVPLRGLGLGSVRLLVAGLQRHVAGEAPMILIDELEHGLEPHRIIRLLAELGAKETNPPLQAFVTSHSPVAVRELSIQQLHVVRPGPFGHTVSWMARAGDVQGTVRKFPDALLARSVLVCEGASEVGLIRGLDLYRQATNRPSLTALGVALVDGGGDTTFARATAFQQMGYRTAVLRDNDIAVHGNLEAGFLQAGGQVFKWTDGHALEDELFVSLSIGGVKLLLERAIDLKEESVVADHIRSVSQNAYQLETVKNLLAFGSIDADTRTMLGRASRTRKGWFKNVSAMEAVAQEIVAPDLHQTTGGQLRPTIDAIFAWIDRG